MKDEFSNSDTYFWIFVLFLFYFHVFTFQFTAAHLPNSSDSNQTVRIQTKQFGFEPNSQTNFAPAAVHWHGERRNLEWCRTKFTKYKNIYRLKMFGLWNQQHWVNFVLISGPLVLYWSSCIIFHTNTLLSFTFVRWRSVNLSPSVRGAKNHVFLKIKSWFVSFLVLLVLLFFLVFWFFSL